MKVRVTKVPEIKAQEGASIPETSGNNTNHPVAELEEGEVFQDTEGAIKKVSDNAGTHEEGGVLLDDVHKVLEDTGDKRDDKDSETLLMSPDEVYERTGFRPKRKITHSKAYELATEYYDKKLKSVENKIKISLKNAKFTNSKASQNSLDLNLQLLEAIPTKDELFQSIFKHQEEVKETEGIEPENEDEAQYGNLYGVFNNIPSRVNRPANMDNPSDPMDILFNKVYGTNPTPEAATDNNSDQAKSGIPKGITPSEFNQPLTFNDLMQPLYSLLNSNKTPVNINFPKVTIPSVRLLDPRASLAAGEAAYNRALSILPNTGVGLANVANVFAQKYQIDNQILGQFENQNKQILNNNEANVANLKTQQSASDVNLIDAFETKRLTRDEAFRQQRMADLGNISDKVALNKRFNREGQYLLDLFPHFNQNAEFNGNQYNFTNPSAAGSPQSDQTDFQVRMFTDPETGQQIPFIGLPTGKGGVTWKRASFNKNQTWTNNK